MPPSKRKRKKRPLTAPKKKQKYAVSETLLKKQSAEEDETLETGSVSDSSPYPLVPIVDPPIPTRLGCKPGRKQTLKPDVEKKLYKLALRRPELGMTLKQYLDVVGEVANALDMPFSKGIPGKHWYQRMMDRHVGGEDAGKESSGNESDQDEESEKIDDTIEDAIETVHLSNEEEKKKSTQRPSYYMSYDEEAMRNAIEAVTTKKMSVFGAANHFKVPRSTLRDRTSGAHPNGSKAGPKRILSNAVEKELFSLAKKRAKFGLSMQDFLEIAGEIAAEKNMPFPNGRPSMNWFRKMMKRNQTRRVVESDSDSGDSSDENDMSVKHSEILRQLGKKFGRKVSCRKRVTVAKKTSRRSRPIVKKDSPAHESDVGSDDSNASFENDMSLSELNDSSSEHDTSFDSTCNASSESAKQDCEFDEPKHAPEMDLEKQHVCTTNDGGDATPGIANAGDAPVNSVQIQVPVVELVCGVGSESVVKSDGSVTSLAHEVIHVPVSCVEESVVHHEAGDHVAFVTDYQSCPVVVVEVAELEVSND